MKSESCSGRPLCRPTVGGDTGRYGGCPARGACALLLQPPASPTWIAMVPSGPRIQRSSWESGDPALGEVTAGVVVETAP